MGYARKVDGNQAEIVRELRARGYLVRKNTTGDGAEDLTVSRPTWGFAILLEVKRNARARYRPKQLTAIAEGWPVRRVNNVEDAMAILERVQP